MIKNAKTLPKVYYGLHFVPGVAQYSEPQVNDGKPYRILVTEQAIKNMDASFAGRPLFVNHVDGVNLDNIQTEADGYVVESFFNKLDGKHWAKFIAVSDKAHEAIAKGWRLSNAYVPKQFSGGGLCNGVEYTKEVIDGEYEHLAIVPNPRYEESIILTPDQFQEYNKKKEMELSKIANSLKTKGAKSMFNIFKKTKVEDTEFESLSVTLPKSGQEITIAKLINEMDEKKMEEKKENEDKPAVVEEKKENEEPAKEEVMANGDHCVMVGEEKMKVNDLVEKHLAIKDAMSGKKEEKPAEEKPAELHNDEDEEAKKKALELAAHEDKEIQEKKHNAFETLKNAPFAAVLQNTSIELSEDKVARGKARYGSK